LAQLLWMLAKMLMLPSERVTSPGSRQWKFGKPTDMLDIVCVVSADCPEERGYVLRGGHGKIEAILGVEQPVGFAVDGLVRAEEPKREFMSLIVTSPRVKRFFVQ
jgi:hypothetical protein